MGTTKALKQYVEELETYENYMECYEEYKTSDPELARHYRAMAMEERTHCNMLLSMYPELKEMIDKLVHHNTAN